MENTQAHPIVATEVRAVVLLVDNQAATVEAIRRMLEGCRDIEFHFCSDAVQAEEIAMEVLPTVILQELKMPGLDGLTLVKRYRVNSALREVPVMMLSDLVAPEIKANAFARWLKANAQCARAILKLSGKKRCLNSKH